MSGAADCSYVRYARTLEGPPRRGVSANSPHFSCARLFDCQFWSCTRCRSGPRGLVLAASSDSVYLRHPKLTAYRCSLPGLTGFAAPRRAGPGHQRYFPGQSPRSLNLEREFNPAIADCGFRAPLAPRLARPRVMVSRIRKPLSSQIWQRKYGDVVELLPSSLPPDGVRCHRSPLRAPDRLPLASQTPLM